MAIRTRPTPPLKDAEKRAVLSRYLCSQNYCSLATPIVQSAICWRWSTIIGVGGFVISKCVMLFHPIFDCLYWQEFGQHTFVSFVLNNNTVNLCTPPPPPPPRKKTVVKKKKVVKERERGMGGKTCGINVSTVVYGLFLQEKNVWQKEELKKANAFNWLIRWTTA